MAVLWWQGSKAIDEGGLGEKKEHFFFIIMCVKYACENLVNWEKQTEKDQPKIKNITTQT